ncbi:hypothetical protein CERSUDRAFT_110092 [Gelatoporia subvermispora B]|uniref:GYF domain-containing protein n=1 Tax=Ceriporiopsis subvermispora (strain B) TaxID=914234 RepID=M2PXE6_CERS8|nr:hypothetical protein CERSUDRAFT_110092 [Gelatoporia subvermispora B]
MTTSTMHFGPEWMRTKQGPSRPGPSPPLTAPAPPGNSSYSALVNAAANPSVEIPDTTNPFRYSKEDMLRIYKEGGGKGGLGLEVERWDGIVREMGSDPVGLKELSEHEKKLFAGSLNSEIRRRQSTDFLSPLATSGLERPKLNHSASGAGSPMRERIGNLVGRRRDSTDQPPLSLPRKLSLSSMQGGLTSPREAALPSPRTRIGHTPGFDGVLNESWSARRRVSEGGTKPGGTSRADRDTGNTNADDKGLDIKEEEEEESSASGINPSGESSQPLEPGPTQDTTLNQNGAAGIPNEGSTTSANEAMANISLRDHSPQLVSSGPATGDPALSRPPGVPDVTSIEWSYIDPQGQIQGPFRADVMQRWHDEGYFTSDLLMKCIHLDLDWTPVGELVRRAGSNPVFLTPTINSVAPPGLPRRPDPLLGSSTPDRERTMPYQPTPTRSLRSSTLDSFLNNGSSASASPSSSFGGARFFNGSPDPSTFDGRMNSHVFSETHNAPRIAALTGNLDPTITGRRGGFNDPFDPNYGARLNLTPIRSVEGLGFGGVDNSQNVLEPGPFSPGFHTGGVDGASSTGSFSKATSANGLRGQDPLLNGHTTSSPFAGADYGPVGGFGSPSGGSRVVNRDVFARSGMEDSRHYMAAPGPHMNGAPSHYTPNGQHFPQGSNLQYSSQLDGRSLHSLNTHSERQSAMAQQTLPAGQHQHSFASPGSGTQSAWPPPQDISAFRRPGPFEPNFPTVSNTVPITPVTPSHPTYAPAMQTAPEQSPWFPTQSAANEAWPTETVGLTAANLGQHDTHQQEEEASVPTSVAPVATSPPQIEAVAQPVKEVLPSPVTAAAEGPVVPSAAPEPAKTAKAARKAQTTAVAAQTQVPKASSPPIVAAPAPIVAIPLTPVSAEPKSAWSTEDVQKAKPATTTLSLREIQEAETKKLEVRKAAERERERAARAAAAATPAEEIQTFTTSWGLPTSQASAARTPTAKDSVTSPSPTSTTATPVWTNVPKAPVAKKTMKEIQEEEERRKKLAAKEKETVAAAARRAYAETTTKTTTPVQPSGGAWTTVGIGGKTPAVVAAPTRPPMSTAASSKAVASASAVATPLPAGRTPAIAAPSPRLAGAVKASKSEEAPSAPSHEFLKWLTESLKGLNNSVNIEEISSMLLSFALDPDPSTLEIISDLIYANSTTMDGRRFAAEYVSRRKADATSRPKAATPASTSSKPLSIADVVKTQPKPAQNEWGGFKVVNKKKKGARA